MPKDDELKPRYQFKPKKDEPVVSGVKKVLEERRETGSKAAASQASKTDPRREDKKSPSFLDSLTHIPEQLLDAEAKMMSQVQQSQSLQAKDLEKKLEDANKKADDYLDRLKYLQAEFDNFRKRTEREKLESGKYAGEGVMKDILPFLDEFEISISAIKDEKTKEGFLMLQKNLFKILQCRGLEKIEAMDKKFDPYLHEVVMMQPSDKAEGIILMEVQKGYKINGRVLRYSKVVVSAGSQPKAEKPVKEGEI